MSVLPCSVFLLPLDGTQKRGIGIPGKRNHVGIGIDIAVFLYKAVIDPVQISDMLLQCCLILRPRQASLFLVLEVYQSPDCLCDLQKPFDALRFLSCDVLLIHPGMFPVIQVPIRQCIGEVAYFGVCRDGLSFRQAVGSRHILFLLRFLVLPFQIADGTPQPLIQIVPWYGVAGRTFLIAIYTLVKHHAPQHHLRVVDEPGIHGDAVRILLH